MSENHEMQFADPAWQPGTTQDATEGQSNPAPQPAWTPPPDMGGPGAAYQGNPTEQQYAQGYRGQFGQEENFQAPPQQAPFRRQQQPFFQPQQIWYNSVPRWVWIVIAIIIITSILSSGIGTAFGIILLLCLCGGIGWLIYSGKLRINPGGETQAPETRTFEVSAHPTLVINNKAGSVRVRAGQDGQMSITTTRRGYLFNQRSDNDAQISYNQDAASNRVTAQVESWKAMGKNAIDFEIAVPPQSNLELVTNAGVVSVQDVSGQMTLRSDAGTISASQVSLRGQSRLRTNAGSISFAGTLDPVGDYELSTNLGTVDATLVADTSFYLEAKTDLGTVTTNFPLAHSQTTSASGQVGSGPYPRLQLRTNLGTITVHRQ